MPNNTKVQTLAQAILDKCILKHCRCCDLSKHYYDEKTVNDIVTQLTAFESTIREEAVNDFARSVVEFGLVDETDFRVHTQEYLEELSQGKETNE
jgi:hypothetical protein